MPPLRHGLALRNRRVHPALHRRQLLGVGVQAPKLAAALRAMVQGAMAAQASSRSSGAEETLRDVSRSPSTGYGVPWVMLHFL
jgi:hypothetical protein